MNWKKVVNFAEKNELALDELNDAGTGKIPPLSYIY